MAWTAPMTAVASTAFTAAQFNTHVRDNLLETAPAKATTAGRIFVATGANSIAERVIDRDTVGAAQTTSSTSYTDLATVGPAVTATTGTNAIVMISSEVANDTTASISRASFAVSGASTIAASNNWAISHSGTATHMQRQASVRLEKGLTAGSNTFTMKYAVSANTGTFGNREIVVIAL